MSKTEKRQQFIIQRVGTSADDVEPSMKVNAYHEQQDNVLSGNPAWSSQLSIYAASLGLCWLLVVSQLKLVGYYYGYLVSTNPMSTSFAWDTILLMSLVGSFYTTRQLIHYAWQYVLNRYQVRPEGYVQQWINMSAHSVHKFGKAFTTYMTFLVMLMWSYYIYGKQIDDISGLSTIIYTYVTGFWTNASIYFLAPAATGQQPVLSATHYANMLNNYQ